MPRKLRIEYAGALYHVINRGNYRADIFADAGARDAFEACLFEACGKAGWRLHAYAVMRNHYHLALETPAANLVEGMRWLQATFANRFNRFRQEQGHVFQGRYRAALVETLADLGAVGHYIHLNPVRAGIVTPAELGNYPHTSFKWLDNPRNRPAPLTFEAALMAAGDLADSKSGWRRYREYLAWLATDEPAQKQLAFERMSRSWAIGTTAFKKSLVSEHKDRVAQGASGEDRREAREIAWQAEFDGLLQRAGKTPADIAGGRKSADWKVAVAVAMKATTTATNPWLAGKLGMGAPEGVSRYAAECRQGKREGAGKVLGKISNIKV